MRRPSYDNDRLDPFPDALPRGYPAYPSSSMRQAELRAREIRYKPQGPMPRGEPLRGPDPYYDRGPPLERRFRSPSPPPHVRGMPGWGPGADRHLLPPARIVRYMDDPLWPSRPPSPGARPPMAGGLGPRRRMTEPLDPGLDPRLAPLYPQKPMQAPGQRYPSPTRGFPRPSSGSHPPMGDPMLQARSGRAASCSPPRRGQQFPHYTSQGAQHAPLGRVPGELPERGWSEAGRRLPQQLPGSMGRAPLVHGDDPLAYRAQRASPPLRGPYGRASPEPRGGPMLAPLHRGPSPRRDMEFHGSRDAMRHGGPDGYGSPGLGPLRSSEHWEPPSARPGFYDTGGLPPHMAIRYPGARCAAPSPWSLTVASFRTAAGSPSLQ